MLLPGPPEIVTVSVPPAATVPGEAVTLGPLLHPITVTGALLVSSVQVLFEKKRNSYCPAVEGMVKLSVAELRPAPGGACSL